MVASEEEKTFSDGHNMWARALGWCSIGLLIAFLINNILVVGFGFKEIETIAIGVNGQNFLTRPRKCCPPVDIAHTQVPTLRNVSLSEEDEFFSLSFESSASVVVVARGRLRPPAPCEGKVGLLYISGL